VLRVVVKSPVWLEQMRSMQPVLERELARIAEVKLTGIHFEVQRSNTGRAGSRTGPEKLL
jgi:hypothetical protein